MFDERPTLADLFPVGLPGGFFFKGQIPSRLLDSVFIAGASRSSLSIAASEAAKHTTRHFPAS